MTRAKIPPKIKSKGKIFNRRVIRQASPTSALPPPSRARTPRTIKNVVIIFTLFLDFFKIHFCRCQKMTNAMTFSDKTKNRWLVTICFSFVNLRGTDLRFCAALTSANSAVISRRSGRYANDPGSPWFQARQYHSTRSRQSSWGMP